MISLINPWEEFDFSNIPEGYDISQPHYENYGGKFPTELPQIAVELTLFRETLKKKNIRRPDGLDRFYHGMNIVRLIWNNEHVELFRDPDEDTAWDERIWNNYFLTVFRALCSGRGKILTGPAGASKSFVVAIYSLICFFSAPKGTSFLVSTTSAGASERRIWGYLKKLHNKARWKIGTAVDYLKVITLDKDEIQDKKQGREISNGIILVPIANDSTGDAALDTVMGTHNDYVYWAIDELPAMKKGVLRPVANLEINAFFQLIGAGNASSKGDPHGLACEPANGWESLSLEGTCEYEGKEFDVVFLHGSESPNDNPKIDASKILEKDDFPFPYLTNSIGRNNVAKIQGRGDEGIGKETQEYYRFCIGKWPDVASTMITLVNYNEIRRYGADKKRDPWGPDGYKTFWGLDPDYTTGGDGCSLTPLLVGYNYLGTPQIVFPRDSHAIKPSATDKESYRESVARVVFELSSEMVNFHPRQGAFDAMHDGGLLLRDLVEIFDSNAIKPLSSIGSSSDPECGDMPTEYWLSVQKLIRTGYVREYNIASSYSADLTTREYHTLKTKMSRVDAGIFIKQLESKVEYRKKHRRSPNDGDSLAYCCWHVLKNSGIDFRPKKTNTKDTEGRSINNQLLEFMIGLKQQKRRDDYAVANETY
jgi:hypothetical protein